MSGKEEYNEDDFEVFVPTPEDEALQASLPLLQTSSRTIPSTITQEPAVLKAVERFAYRRHEDLSASSVVGFDEEELDRIKRNDQGHLVFTVDSVRITETELIDDELTYYVSATLNFQTDTEPVGGSTDIYQCYRCGNDWCIEWYAS
jgi:hypothetical protein